MTELEQLFEDGLQKYEAQDFRAAFESFMRAAEMGDAHSQNYLGCMYGNGEGVEKDAERELFWHKRAWKKDRSSAHASNVAQTYANQGQRRLAIAWWRKSVAMDDGDAAVSLAKYLMDTPLARPSEAIDELLEMALSCTPPLNISPAGLEEAQELWDSLPIGLDGN